MWPPVLLTQSLNVVWAVVSVCVLQEQAIEREHERDDFQQEIRRLEAQLRQTAGVEGKGHRVRSNYLIGQHSVPSVSQHGVVIYTVILHQVVFLGCFYLASCVCKCAHANKDVMYPRLDEGTR